MATANPIQPTAIHDHLGQSGHTASTNTMAVDRSSQIPRGDVRAKFNFYGAPLDGSKPYGYTYDPPPGEPKTNYQNVEADVDVHDIRGREASFNLDDHAFEAHSGIVSAETDFDDDERIKQVYYPEVEQLLLDKVPGAQKVVIFDHTIRRSGPDVSRGPVTRVHIDQTKWAAEQRVRVHCPDDAETLLRGRYRIINVWRPLNGPVVAHPLAVADSSSVRPEDIVPVEHRYPHRTGQTAGVGYNAGQRWYYWSGMTNDERFLLKCSDNDPEIGRFGQAPHSAFVHPGTPADGPGRESIEVRTLVFG